MLDSGSKTDLLKNVLENLRTPEKLNDHPWTDSLFVKAYLSKPTTVDYKSSGYELAMAVGALFLEMMPSSEPKRGKRLDTHWGEFGLLAAQYFVPFKYGQPYPVSLRDAWGKIDHAILACQFGEKVNDVSEAEIERFRLVGSEPNIAPLSTISDWHVKGIEKLASFIQDREQHLRLSPSDKPVVDLGAQVNAVEETHPDPNIADSQRTAPRRFARMGVWVVITALVVGLIFVAGKAWTIYQLALLVKTDAVQLQEFAAPPFSLERVIRAGPTLSKFRQDVEKLRTEAGPILRFSGPWLANVPVYGTDLAASADLLELAGHTAAALELSYQAAGPIMDLYPSDSASLEPQRLVRILADGQSQLLTARQELDIAISLQKGFAGKQFSPRTQAMLDRLDPMLSLLDDGLNMAVALPSLLGAGDSGPKTYMLLVQNDDEIRPTGGFITSVGSFVIRNGDLFGLQFEEAGDLEDWSLPYPDAPWQLAQYMNSQVLVLRDANWFTSYPTAVGWIEYLYAYNHKHTVDGVIAIDQQMLVSLLRVIGPLSLEGLATPVTSDNVIEYMRNAKIRPPNAPADWYRKAFISQIGNALVARLVSNDRVDWRGLAQLAMRNLNERHIMLQFDDAHVSALLSKWDLDGAIRPGTGDFLMTVDTNVGFNKTNAVVDSRLSYDVDLTNLQPTGKLIISHSNHAEDTISCLQLDQNRPEGYYPVNLCYWNYLRVYVAAGTRLDNASVHAVPADWMILKQSVPARVDTLEEDIPGVQSYGTLMVVPGGQTYNTGFDFSLPAQVISVDPVSKARVYTLKIKKQPGTVAVPAVIRLHLPASAQVVQTPAGAVVDGQNVLIETKLTTDVLITVMFTVP